ncbi:MAG: DUF1592 domain-containing protein [Verrucomicrobiaceae bacterium]
MRLWPVIFLSLLSGILSADDFVAKTRPFLEKHCIACHGEDKRKGDIVLHDLNSLDDAFKKYRLLENIIDQVHYQDMPPDDHDVLPSDDERKAFIKTLSEVTDRIKSGDVPQLAGRTTLRRLNKNEYNATVRDLFGVNFNPGANFPADGAGGEGFDNMADALFSSPSLLEKYLNAAKKVVASVYSSPALKGKVIFASPSKPDQAQSTAEKVLNYHATLAYRRRVSDEDMAPLLSAFAKGQQSGLSYSDSLRAPLTALLINPRFLFRAEHDQSGKEEWRLTDFEIATRLSYFLWSSMPDRELFRIADEGKLSDPEVLKAQVLRMIDSPKSDAFAKHFAGQWLGFKKMIDEVEPDPERFPEFNNELRRAMYYEGLEFFTHLVRENRPITELIDSDYTFANATLAKHYDLKEKVTGKKLQKVTLHNKNRGGVLGMGAILTSTSLPLRTSPVHRGVWILDSLLGDPAPPPPPNAGELPADDTQAGGLTFREQLAAHREKAACASCHARIDPLGFGLENYDAIGRWRTKDANGKPIDSTAVLPGDIEFSTPHELKQLVMFGKDKFASNMTRKLISYATGRSLEYYDEATVSQIVANIAKKDYSTQDLILEVVQSRPFQNRSATR